MTHRFKQTLLVFICFVVVQHKNCIDMVKLEFHIPGRDNYLILIGYHLIIDHQ